MDTSEIITMIVGGVLLAGVCIAIGIVLYRYHAPDYDDEDDDNDDSYHI